MVSRMTMICFEYSLLLLFRHLERARIVFAIESEMSTEERDLPTNKYWTNVDGERYLQVEEVDDETFRAEEEEGEGENNKDDEEIEDNHANETKL